MAGTRLFVQSTSYKIVSVGKTLQNDEMSLEEMKISNNSKMILLGRKVRSECSS